MGELDEIFRVLGEEPMDKTVQSLCNGLKQHHCHCIRLYYLKFLACPARFERATYALEEFMAVQNINEVNGLSQKTSTVQQTVQC